MSIISTTPYQDLPNKPAIIFTNFWDADKITSSGFCLAGDEDTFLVRFIDGAESNFEFFSVALQNPPMDKFKMIPGHGIKSIDMMAPTFDMLMQYKKNKDWDAFAQKYNKLIVERKKDIRLWLNKLVPGRIYLLCCWENTCKSANCHRSLLYKAFMQSQHVRENFLVFYRDGGIISAEKDIDAFGRNVSCIPSQTQGIGHPIVADLALKGLIGNQKYKQDTGPELETRQAAMPRAEQVFSVDIGEILGDF